MRQGQSASPQRNDPGQKVLFAPTINRIKDFNQTQPINFATIASNQQTIAAAGNTQTNEETQQDKESLVSLVGQYNPEIIA